MQSTEKLYQSIQEERANAFRAINELTERIAVVKSELIEMDSLKTYYKVTGKQADFEEFEDAYQQAYQDYIEMVGKHADLQDEIQQLNKRASPIEEYFRDTGFYPTM